MKQKDMGLTEVNTSKIIYKKMSIERKDKKGHLFYMLIYSIL